MPNLVQDYKEPIYETLENHGHYKMGSFASFTWKDDPRHVLFSMARYKFCAKMLRGKKHIFDVGCGDGFCLPILLQEVETVHGVDIEPVVIEEVKVRPEFKAQCSFELLDMSTRPLEKKYDAAVSMDVIEHVEQSQEAAFMRNIASSLQQDGVFIVGTPNVTAKEHASEISNRGHINLKSGEQLHQLVQDNFHNAFSFSMNDEIVHTGFTPMAHYIFCMGVGPR